MKRALKQPSAEQSFVYDFSGDLGSATIAEIIGLPTSEPRGNGANLAQEGAAIVGTTDVLVKWTGGVDGESYLTTVKVRDTAGNEHEVEGQIEVREIGFLVPENISSRYLTAEEYVARYGTAETVRLTDEVKANVVDGVKLEAALRDATDFADGYIGNRYSTPLVSVPRVVKSIVGALAREALHKTRPTPEVSAAAERARSELRDISAGRMVLPVEQGDEVPVINGNQGAIRSNDASTTFRDAVAGFTIDRPNYAGNWRR